MTKLMTDTLINCTYNLRKNNFKLDYTSWRPSWIYKVYPKRFNSNEIWSLKRPSISWFGMRHFLKSTDRGLMEFKREGCTVVCNEILSCYNTWFYMRIFQCGICCVGTYPYIYIFMILGRTYTKDGLLNTLGVDLGTSIAGALTGCEVRIIHGDI